MGTRGCGDRDRRDTSVSVRIIIILMVSLSLEFLLIYMCEAESLLKYGIVSCKVQCHMSSPGLASPTS